ncbi:MAG: GMC family oxidoreductase [Acidobacteria bacterium]|nr:GMC family oxidoreductase [Acidobacteriota bacterium]
MTGPEHFDTVVIGSGFGGAVSSYRLAEAGLAVCVLERGKAYPPRSFPRNPADMSRNFWDPSAGLHGMFNIWSFRGLEAVVSSGLGGGSLIYANVLLRKDEHWFVHHDPFDGGYETWPISRADLDPHYDRVETMMNAQQFPFESDGYGIAKTKAMRDAADGLGLEWQLPPLAVTFHNKDRPPVPGEPLADREFPNLHGLPRQTCRLCGECDIGCNYGAKNTLDHNYLSAAKHEGATIRTRCEVRVIRPGDDDGYVVQYVEHDPMNEGRQTETKRLPLVTVTCDRLVLGAGTFGSTYLLLRNRSAFPSISRALGTRFCGNGDLLGLMVETKTGRPGHERPRRLNGAEGPVITSAIRIPDGSDPDGQGRGFYIEDAGFPEFAGWLVEMTQAGSRASRVLRFAVKRLLAKLTNDPRSDWGAAISEALGGAELSVSSLPLLGMGRDVPDGNMRLNDGRLDVDWTTESSQPFFDRVEQTMRDITEYLGGSFQPNLLSYLDRVISVHPLGGAPMADNPADGVVDAYGEVFGYPELYVVDGSAMPGPVGANPALTIAAFADRAMDHAIEHASAGRA